MADGTTLPAGRELDALIAERVGGAAGRMTVYAWHDRKRREFPMIAFAYCPEPFGGFLRRDFHSYATEDGKKWDGPVYLPRAYSNNIAAAWEVVERMREHAPVRYKNLSLVAYCYDRTYATFDAEAFTEYDSATWVEANGEHATPLAICYAALATLPPGRCPMSARGWAGLLGTIADHAETWEEPFAADLRELAALLDRIEPRMARALNTPTDDRTDIGAKLAADAVEIIAALARGPAEQQEAGR